MTAVPVVAITGASGMLGSHLCRHLALRGWQVRALARRPDELNFDEPAISTHRCDLPEELDESTLAGATAVIHCAYMTRFTTLDEARRVNEGGTERILAAARRHEAGRFVFISSLASNNEAESYYARSKWTLERRLDARRDTVIRPGLILAPGSQGLFGRLVDSVRKSRFIPLLDGGRQVLQTIHAEDLSHAIVNCIEKDLAGTFPVAEPTGLPFRQFLEAIASRLSRAITPVPIPSLPTLWVLRTAERFGLRLAVSSEQLLGLRAMHHVPTREALKRVGVEARPAAQSLDELLSLPTRPYRGRKP